MELMSFRKRSPANHRAMLTPSAKKRLGVIFFAMAATFMVLGAGVSSETVLPPPANLIAAALAGNAEAQNLLGLAYIDGKHGCVQDSEKGIRWLKKATANGSRNAHVLKRPVMVFQVIVQKRDPHPDDLSKKEVHGIEADQAHPARNMNGT